MSLAGRALLERLPDMTLAALAPHLDRDLRRELRDSALRKAIAASYSNMSITAAARGLAADLATGGTPGTRHGDAIALLLALSDGRPLRYRRLLEIVNISATCTNR